MFAIFALTFLCWMYFVLHVLSFGIVFCLSSWLSSLLARHPLFVIVTDSIDAIRIVASFFLIVCHKTSKPSNEWTCSNLDYNLYFSTTCYCSIIVGRSFTSLLMSRTKSFLDIDDPCYIHTHQEREKEKIEGKWVKWNGIF